MNEERRALQVLEYRRWQEQRNRAISKQDAAISESVENRETTVQEGRNMSMPPFKGYNVIDSHIYSRLRNLWKSESEWWSLQERRDFIRWVPRARVTEQQKSIASHGLAKYMRNNRSSWGHFVILRAMFGASQCAREKWWEDFKGRYERAAEEAPPGVVPRDVDEVLETNLMDAPPLMNIPTMEVEGRHVGEDCGCKWCLKYPDKARRNNESVGLGGKIDKTGLRLDYCREQSVYMGEEEEFEDWEERVAREQGVEPEETPEEEGIDEIMSELVIQMPSLGERMGAVSTYLSEIVLEQRGVIERLARLVEEQRQKTEMLEARVKRVERDLERNKNRRNIGRRAKSFREREP
ncbi:hypothetical protein ACQKWADRAFT_289172 [Trichoderma austrokoningii]